MPQRLVVVLLLLAAVPGCKRAFYRQQADSEVNCLVDSKAALVGSEVGTLRIDIDPRSRMYSPENPDCPAMPPDDPVAHAFLECVDGKRGARTNRCAQRTPYVENPGWLAHLPRAADGVLELDLTGAVGVGLVHSTDFQGELEELYLSALDVTFERFRFDAQFFGGSSVFFTADGRDRNGSGSSSSLLEVDPSRSGNRFRTEKLTATGGELVVGLANSLVWQFAGSDNYTSNTLLDFSIVQPLLRTGGRTVVLERLTIAERALLANVRSMERFRRGFYLNIATGRDPGAGPSRRGGFFGGSGLDGFSGVGGGGFGRVGGVGGGFTGGAGAAAAGGYIGLLQQGQELRNQRANIAALRSSVDQLQASYDAGRIDRFQVDLARQALFDAQSRLLSAEADFQTQTDSFLVNLGLPPDIPMRLSDPLLDPFQLRSLELTSLQSETAETAASLREQAITQQQEQQTPETSVAEELPSGPAIASSPAVEPQLLPGVEHLDATGRPLAPAALKLAAEALEELDRVEADYEMLLEALPARKEHLQELGGREEVNVAQIEANLLSPDRLERRIERLRQDMDLVGNRLRVIAQALLEKETSLSAAEQRKRVTELSSLLLELSLLQARARLDAIDIDPTDLSDQDALAIASLYRRDWKNARASLVDAWRLVNFNANNLLSDLDITFSGDMGNLGDNPFDLRDTTGRLRVGLEFDGPITRLSERNTYRQSLIEYQQARRSYYQFVDRVSQGLRASLRQVRLNEINFELRREAVLVAIAQVDLTQLRLSEPPKPGEESQFSSTTARDLVQALSDLLNVQNDFLSVWVNNHVQLLNLELDLGLMELDQQGHRMPLAMPLGAYRDALVCPHEGGPERLPADIALPPCELKLPDDSSPELLMPDVAMGALGNPMASGFDSALMPVSYQQLGPKQSPKVRRLPLP